MAPANCWLVSCVLVVMYLKGEIERMLKLIQVQWILLLSVIVSAERLPGNIVPLEYKLEILTNLGITDLVFDFTGYVVIHVKCVSPTDSIVLHSKNLNIDKETSILKALNETDDPPSILEFSEDAENDFLILKLSQSLQADQHYKLKLHYAAELREEKLGFYRSYYMTASRKKKWIAVTYFKPNHARRAFPCFDELPYKAKFTLTLGVTLRHGSISNMPLLMSKKMHDRRGWKWDLFETTPPMSTYKVAFAVVSFPYEQVENDRLAVRSSFWSRQEVYEEMDYVVRFSRQLVYIFQTNFDMKYSLPKLDIIAVPKYAVPIKENWGVVIWQEEYLLQITTGLLGYNPEIFGVVAKQMVRQWVSNLVTLETWEDAWFVEGFCRYFAEVAVDEFIFPDLEWLSYEITANHISVLEFDSLRNARAVTSKRSSTIETVNSGRADKKTFLLFHMLSNFIGPENLRAAVHDYLQLYAYKNAGCAEFIEIVNKRSNFRNNDVKTVMDSWFNQAGFPIITVTRNYKQGTLEVKQERFFKDGDLLGKNDTTKWWIPLTYTTECELNFNGSIVRNWLSPHHDSIVIQSPISSADWVLFNVYASGLYMVNYDEENWNLIIDFLKKPFFERIPTENRAVLINNAATLAWVGRMNYKTLFNMIKYMVHEKDNHPVYAAILCIDSLNTLLKRTPIHAKFVAYVKELHQERRAIIERTTGVDWDVDNPRDDAQVFSAACKFEPHDCVEGPLYRTHQRSGFSHIFASFEIASATNLQSMTVTSWDTLYCRVVFLEESILCTGEVAKQYAWNLYIKSKNDPELRNDILRSLVCSKNKSLLQIYLEKSIGGTSTRNQDIGPIVSAVAGSRMGFGLVMKFLSENIGDIHYRVSSNGNQLLQIIIDVARNVMSEDELSWLKKFISHNSEYFRDLEDGMAEALEIAKTNVQWHHKHYRTVETYLNQHYDNDFNHNHF